MRWERDHPREEARSRPHVGGSGGTGPKGKQGSALDTHRFEVPEVGEVLPRPGVSHFEVMFIL